jgi:hypothetical protein
VHCAYFIAYTCICSNAAHSSHAFTIQQGKAAYLVLNLVVCPHELFKLVLLTLNNLQG